MAITTFGPLWIPEIPHHAAAAPVFAAGGTLSSAAHKFAWIFRVPKTGTLDKFEWLPSTVANNPDNGMRCSFQDVDLATGFPDGGQDQYRDFTSGLSTGVWVAPGLMTSDGTDTGTKRSVTAGDYIACVIEFVSFVAGDSVAMPVLSNSTAPLQLVGNFPYSAIFQASWAVVVAPGVLALKYNDGTYVNISPNWYPVVTFNTTTFNSGSTPDERGLRFEVPVTCRLSGAVVRIDLDADCDLVLYNAAGSAIMTLAIDTTPRSTANGAGIFFPFASQDLVANSAYRLVLKPGASNISIYDFDVNAAAIMGSVPGGTTWHYTERTNAGAWTDTTTKRPWISLLLDGFDDGSDSGGGEHSHVFVG